MRRRLVYALCLVLLAWAGARAPGQEAAPRFKIRFEGLRSVSEADVLRALRERRASISTESVNDPSQVKKAVEVIKELLADEGFRHPSIEARADDASRPPRFITFSINEGKRYRLNEILFEGNAVFTGEELLKAMHYTLKESRAPFPQVDVLYKKELFEYDMRLAQQMMAAAGYLQARLGEPKVEEAGDALKITVPVSEGAVYRLGEIKIEGARQFSAAEILDFLPMKPGDVVNGPELGKAFYERLKAAYGERGFIEYDSWIAPEYRNASSKEGFVDLTVTIDEGESFKVHSIKFVGNKRTPESVLRSALLIREGEVFNQTKFEKSIERLDRLGLFEPLDYRRNAELRTDEENSLLSITIEVREIASP